MCDRVKGMKEISGKVSMKHFNTRLMLKVSSLDKMSGNNILQPNSFPVKIILGPNSSPVKFFEILVSVWCINLF